MAKRRKKSVGMTILSILAILLLVVIIVAFGAVQLAKREVAASGRESGMVTVEIPKGASTRTVAQELEQAGVIGNSLIFRLYSKQVGADGKYQYGEFELDKSWNYDKLIEELSKATNYKDTVTITFPEGYNAFQMGEALEKTGLTTKNEFLDALNNHSFAFDFINEISNNENKLVKLDGFLFPDTYQFFADATVDDIINTMLANFEKKVLTAERKEQLKNSGYSLEQWVIFASIIQKEAANVEEMYNVSSVFTNRMKPNSDYPQLESCTTNNYINDYVEPYFEGKAPDTVVKAFDTYGMAGFPAGAIANPGLDALDAALNPNDTPYYFFVTDIEYTHYYGKTYNEHLANIQKAKAVNKKYGKNGL